MLTKVVLSTNERFDEPFFERKGYCHVNVRDGPEE